MTKVLVCSEFSQIGSGYATYTKELLQGFKKHGLEFAELASFCKADDQRIRNCPWQVYPVMPHSQDEQGWQHYNSHPANAFGRHIFEQVLLDYKPTHVIDVRDVWTLIHEFISPYRDFYSHILMPAVDSDPQNKHWIDMYSKADAIVTYCNWAKNLLTSYGLKNVVGAASPIPSSEFKPLEDKKKLQAGLGLGDIKIIGTVMRNQPRKLIPQLFEMFSNFLSTSKRDDIYLYAHTSYPDVWELDELLLKYNIGHKTLFTYSCIECQNIEMLFYQGAFATCPRCRKHNTLKLPNTSQPIPQNALNYIYNLFDLYIQYAALEGYGLPPSEAIATGVPTMCIRYSAMETFIDEGYAIPIEVSDYHIEPESGRRFAIPNEADAISKIQKFFDSSDDEKIKHSKLARMVYGVRTFDDCVDVWMKAIHNTAPKKAWDAKFRYNPPPQDFPRNLPNDIFAKWLIVNVLQDESYLGSYMEARLVRDLEQGFAYIGHDNKYYYEALNIPGQRFQPFSKEIAFTHFSELIRDKIKFEQLRVSRL